MYQAALERLEGQEFKSTVRCTSRRSAAHRARPGRSRAWARSERHLAATAAEADLGRIQTIPAPSTVAPGISSTHTKLWARQAHV